MSDQGAGTEGPNAGVGGPDAGAGAAMPAGMGGGMPGGMPGGLDGGAMGGPLADPASLARVLDVSVQLSVELGRRRMSIADVLDLRPGSVVEFQKAAQEPLDIRVNGQLVARGEAVVMGDRYGVRVTEVVSPNERLRTSGLVKEG